MTLDATNVSRFIPHDVIARPARGGGAGDVLRPRWSVRRDTLPKCKIVHGILGVVEALFVTNDFVPKRPATEAREIIVPTHGPECHNIKRRVVVPWRLRRSIAVARVRNAERYRQPRTLRKSVQGLQRLIGNARRMDVVRATTRRAVWLVPYAVGGGAADTKVHGLAIACIYAKANAGCQTVCREFDGLSRALPAADDGTGLNGPPLRPAGTAAVS
jgi:hypothetical protein